MHVSEGELKEFIIDSGLVAKKDIDAAADDAKKRKQPLGDTLVSRGSLTEDALRARGIGPGDAVICPSFTFCATAEVAVLVGATPVFVDIAAGNSQLEADREKMAEVFENLLSNAAKYSPPENPIRLFGGVSGDDYEFGVADQGIGMTEEQVKKIFDKFYRADASNTAPAGLGLGMSLVRTIVEAHGGRIWVESRQKQGTTVRFTLPLAGSCKGDNGEKNPDCR